MMTTPPTIDPTNPEALMRELFDDDRWVKHQFAAHLAKALLEFCEALAACFRLMAALNEIANQEETKRTALVGAFVFGVLGDILVSTKLLLTGKLPAAGNLVRQVLEGIAMAILCSSQLPVIVQQNTKKKSAVRALYWDRLDSGAPYTRGYLAISQLEWNAAALGISPVAITRLSESKAYYNAFSHCGTATIANRVSLEGIGKFHLGGHFG
ncbi:hypothetical protein [Paraburkholderia caribensis]|uniref:hypothetical protein n=1 Tax=Paraburkholderia caribensis TaxID=75105 RepID=UPI001CB46190|nr:hypothetical protein [Paraburkholderia caribensis]CAG9269433.1 conserved hypothetical protein [Paraburkholderia caribensis]